MACTTQFRIGAAPGEFDQPGNESCRPVCRIAWFSVPLLPDKVGPPERPIRLEHAVDDVPTEHVVPIVG